MGLEGRNIFSRKLNDGTTNFSNTEAGANVNWGQLLADALKSGHAVIIGPDGVERPVQGFEEPLPPTDGSQSNE
ncbi:MAG TPA: hypothetical protein PKU78_04785 [Candidatus Dojkabacteria bacterium]|nr:hypothetical protein [Candidatus Dojkabacteria bacterium]HRO65509.1 hypothetical protein [Candidatus Dojkabacteria bacterium]HRP51351.1 hypothetical protein [Candidatus Dojkabacteria bacterium]